MGVWAIHYFRRMGKKNRWTGAMAVSVVTATVVTPLLNASNSCPAVSGTSQRVMSPLSASNAEWVLSAELP